MGRYRDCETTQGIAYLMFTGFVALKYEFSWAEQKYKIPAVMDFTCQWR